MSDLDLISPFNINVSGILLGNLFCFTFCFDKFRLAFNLTIYLCILITLLTRVLHQAFSRSHE